MRLTSRLQHLAPLAGARCWSRSYWAKSWDKARRVVAKVERYPGELLSRVGFIVTNLSRPSERVVAFYNQRGTAEQHISEGKNAINRTRLSCHGFRNNEVVFSGTRSSIIWGISSARSPCPRQWSIGR